MEKLYRLYVQMLKDITYEIMSKMLPIITCYMNDILSSISETSVEMYVKQNHNKEDWINYELKFLVNDKRGRRDTGRYMKGGLLVLGDLNKGYVVLQSFQRNWKTCKYFRFSITLSDVILFRKKDWKYLVCIFFYIICEKCKKN